MRFLLDENLSPRLAALLQAEGHDAVHVRSLGLATASDAVVLDRATAEARVLVSADTDFGALLAVAHRRTPSVVLFRRERPRRAEDQAALLLRHLGDVVVDLEVGAVVVIEEERIRVRRLPIVPG